jgi:uncharacterized protein YwqG
MNRILLKLTKAEKPLPVLSSKLFGMPDVWDEFEWPQPKTHPISGYEYDIEFLCQINCAEAAKYDKDGILPKTGMLYFFEDDLEGVNKKDTAVIYYDGDLSELSPYLPTKDSFHESSFVHYTERVIVFECNSYSGWRDKYAPNDPDYHFLLGRPSDPEQAGLGAHLPPDKWQMLLQIHWNRLVGGSLMEICYFISKSNLANKDFSKAWVEDAYD